jgi:hypothetical protein
VLRLCIAFALLLAASPALAQSLTLDKIGKDAAVPAGAFCTVCGEIRSIRAVPAPPQQLGQPGLRTQSRAAQTDLQQPVPVGAVVSFPFGSGDGYYGWHFGVDRTPEMQAGVRATASHGWFRE